MFGRSFKWNSVNFLRERAQNVVAKAAESLLLRSPRQQRGYATPAFR